MASPSSPSTTFNRVLINRDDSAPSPLDIKREQYRKRTQKSFSHSSDSDDDNDDDDDDDDDDEDNSNVIELLNRRSPLQDLEDVNDALMGVLKSHIELIAATHRNINKNRDTKGKDNQSSQSQEAAFSNNNNDQRSQQGSLIDSQSHYHDFKLNKPTKTTSDVQPSSIITTPKQTTHEQYDEISLIIANTKIPLPNMQKLISQHPQNPQSPQTPNFDGKYATNLISTPLSAPSATPGMTSAHSPPSRHSTPARLPETSEVLVYPSSISLKGLLSYQDVLNAIEREFHLHEGQEREIIMKLWLKGQTMISILQRYRHLLQDLNLDDEDFIGGMKQIREIISYADRDVQYLREQTMMLENQNRFLESEFQRQLDKVITEKNEQISRLIHIIDQTCPPPNEYTDRVSDLTQSSGNQDLVAQKFMQQNVELQRQLETLRVKLEFTFSLINERLDQQQGPSILQVAFDQMRQSDARLQELQLKTVSQQEENDLLKYLLDKSQQSTSLDLTQLFNVMEQRSLDREINRARQELEIVEKRMKDLEQRFDENDETVKFNIENLKLKCDILREHITMCNQRLTDALSQVPTEIIEQKRPPNPMNQYLDTDTRIIQLENEILALRDQYNDLAQYSNTVKYELDSARKQLHERSLLERDTFDTSVVATDSMELEQERQRSAQLEHELRALKAKYEDVCERVTAATIQLERVQVVLEQTLRRCDQLEKEKSEINAQSEYLSQNVASVTAKYKDKMNTIKSRLEHTDRERREAQIRTEQLQNEIERLKNELTHKKEVIFEKDKLIQDVQYKSREILLERQTVEERVVNEYKRLNELVDKNRLLEEELERMRRSQILENITVRRTDVINLDAGAGDSVNRLEELRTKINDCERRCAAEKASRESLQVQIKILEEENADLREIMSQMRRRAQDDRRTDRDRNDEIQQLIARAESNARQYMSNFNISTTSPTSTLVRIIPISSPTRVS